MWFGEQREELERLAREGDRTISYLVRQAVSRYLDDRKEGEEMSGLEVPTDRRLEERGMSIRVLPDATPKALERVRRTWPEARAEDFQREGKLFRDKGSGVLYPPGTRRPAGGRCRQKEDISTWFVSADETGDGIVYLIAADDPGSVTHSVVGEVGGRRMTAQDVMR